MKLDRWAFIGLGVQPVGELVHITNQRHSNREGSSGQQYGTAKGVIVHRAGFSATGSRVFAHG